MAIVTTDNRYYSEIATAIRNKTGGSAKYTPAQMAAAIEDIPAGEPMSPGLVRSICWTPPSGYTWLEYIESSGTQYIDTGYMPNNKSRAVVDVQFTAVPSSNSNIIGCNDGTYYWYLYYRQSNLQHRGRYGTQGEKAIAYEDPTVRVTVENGPDGFRCGEELLEWKDAEFQLTYSAYLFARNNAGAVGTTARSCRIFSCQIYEGSALMRDFVPCINPNGEVGLYDKAMGGFYGNAGTGTFATDNGLPSGYTLVDYIQSSGTQYIDTGVAHDSSSNIVLQADVSYDTVSLANQIMGFNGNGGNGIGLSKAAWWEASSIASATVGTKYSLEWGVNGTSWHRTVNGTKVTGTRSAYTFATNLYLFASQASSTSATMSYHCSCKMYGAKVLVGGTAVRDFIPCKNPSGAYGLYDTVGKKFYGNAGSGAFTGG